MTNFEKIKSYYAVFDEQHRLEKPEGRLEFEVCMRIMQDHLKSADRVLDLGGGAGKYAIELATQGHRVTLADLSVHLLEQAKDYVQSHHLSPLESYDEVNAVDLSCYANHTFDAIVLFGPLYHLLEYEERNQCVAEVSRVLRPGGVVFVNFIPYLSGALGVVSRGLNFPKQVDSTNLAKVFEQGVFQNNAQAGFQEGYYPQPGEIVHLFEQHHFEQLLLRSLRGFGYNREEKLYEAFKTNRPLFDKLMELIDQTATEPAIIETCGHALYVGRKCLSEDDV